MNDWSVTRPSPAPDSVLIERCQAGGFIVTLRNNNAPSSGNPYVSVPYQAFTNHHDLILALPDILTGAA